MSSNHEHTYYHAHGEIHSHGHVHENYSGDNGMGCGVGNSDKFYHWGGLLGYIALDNEKYQEE